MQVRRGQSNTGETESQWREYTTNKDYKVEQETRKTEEKDYKETHKNAGRAG